MTRELRNRGRIVNHKKVLRIMREQGWLCTKFTQRHRKKYSSYKGQVGKVAHNHLNRKFKTQEANQVWVSDVTEFTVIKDRRRLYLSPIMDLFNTEIIAFSLSTSPTVQFTNEALDKALEVLPQNHHLMIHTDQGFHYQHHTWIKRLEDRGITQSMSRKGNCLDNAPIENFFSLLKQEMYYGRAFQTIDELSKAITDYINWYNHHRIKLNLNGLSPIQYRLQVA